MRQFRLQLRPDEVQIEARWLAATPVLDKIQQALSQRSDWRNFEAHPDTACVSSVEDFYRARFLYRLSLGGEAVEAGLAVFARTLARQSELQTVALEDILTQLNALLALAGETAPGPAKVHTALRDLVRVFDGLANNAQAFMASVARTIDLQQADMQAVIASKRRLIDYLNRFVSDLVGRSGTIANRLLELDRSIEPLLLLAVQCKWRDAAPGEEQARNRQRPWPSGSAPGANAGVACRAGSLAVAISRRSPSYCCRTASRPGARDGSQLALAGAQSHCHGYFD